MQSRGNPFVRIDWQIKVIASCHFPFIDCSVQFTRACIDASLSLFRVEVFAATPFYHHRIDPNQIWRTRGQSERTKERRKENGEETGGHTSRSLDVKVWVCVGRQVW
jgi:hypothetical protein